jgi:hypothetical protein
VALCSRDTEGKSVSKVQVQSFGGQGGTVPLVVSGLAWFFSKKSQGQCLSANYMAELHRPGVDGN